ncbi:MAG: AIR synthase-related protein, partial [Candidatus Aminicenantes bacterium]|nr:AIR synthase-related protein [Candidatus Aminicenantes bacterium]
IDESLFIYPDEVRVVCETFGIDPVAAIAEGSLLITVRRDYSKKVLQQLKDEGINASIIGEVTVDPLKRNLKRVDGTSVPLSIPEQDPFWPAFFEGLGKIKF